MKVIRSTPLLNNAIARVFGPLFYSTRPLTAYSSSTANPDSLYSQIWRTGHPKSSVVHVLDKWIEQAGNVTRTELQKIVKKLRHYRRYPQALEVSEWMRDRMNHGLFPGDIAIQLDLVSKVRGLDEAERYFANIPDRSRVLQVYGALLNCYAGHKSLEKAEATMQRMRESGFLKNTLPYNVMLNLYSRMGEFDKLETLLQEIEEKGIPHNNVTLCIQLNALSMKSDIEGVDKLLMKIEADPSVTMDWSICISAANCYLKAGQNEKTATTLKKAEHLLNHKIRKSGYETLLTIYATMGQRDEVFRIWNLYKNLGRCSNTGYLCMVSSLIKLDDIDSAEKILEDWETHYTCFDIRLPSLLIHGYCMKGLLDKAKAYIYRLLESGKELEASTWERLAYKYYLDNHMEEAVKFLKESFMARCRQGWKPNLWVFSCIDYLKEKGDVESALEILQLSKKRGDFSAGSYEKLFNYVHGKNNQSKACDMIEEEYQSGRGKQALELETESKL